MGGVRAVEALGEEVFQQVAAVHIAVDQDLPDTGNFDAVGRILPDFADPLEGGPAAAGIEHGCHGGGIPQGPAFAHVPVGSGGSIVFGQLIKQVPAARAAGTHPLLQLRDADADAAVDI